MGSFSISDLEQLTGVKAHTIRMWEQRYGVLTPARTATNIRVYSAADLVRLLNISTLCERGQRISQVASLSEAALGSAVLACADDAHDHEYRVNALLAALLVLDEPQLNRLLNSASHRLGFEEMMLRVAYPLLQRIGLMWLAGTMQPAQEHLLSGLLRQKTLAAIEALPPALPAARRWVLFLPAAELHELALLFMHYALRARGQHVLYLGQDLPDTELSPVCAVYQPDYVVSVLTLQPARDQVAAFAKGLCDACAGARIVLYGPLTRQPGLVLPPAVVNPLLMTDFLAFVEQQVG